MINDVVIVYKSTNIVLQQLEWRSVCSQCDNIWQGADVVGTKRTQDPGATNTELAQSHSGLQAGATSSDTEPEAPNVLSDMEPNPCFLSKCQFICSQNEIESKSLVPAASRF